MDQETSPAGYPIPEPTEAHPDGLDGWAFKINGEAPAVFPLLAEMQVLAEGTYRSTGETFYEVVPSICWPEDGFHAMREAARSILSSRETIAHASLNMGTFEAWLEIQYAASRL